MLVTGSPAPGRKEVCGWQADKQTDPRAKGQQRCRSSTDCGVVEEVAALLWDGANAVEWRRERQKRHFMQGPPLIWICRTNSLETASEPSTLTWALRAHPGPRPSVRFLAPVYQVRVRVEREQEDRPCEPAAPRAHACGREAVADAAAATTTVWL